MTDERIENELRAWLAGEAARIAMPDGLRDAAATARALPAPRWTLGWPVSLPRPVLAGVTGLLAVVTGASLVLSGILPIGQADCSRVSVESVRAAAEAVPGYTYRMNGSELQARPIPGGEGEDMRLEYATATYTFQGVYRAPADWSIEIAAFEDAGMPVPPTVGFFLLNDEWDAYLLVDERGWVRPIGSDRYTPLPPDGPDLRWLSPNRLADILAGEPFRVSIEGNPAAHEVPLTWSVASEPDACRLVSAKERFNASSAGSWTLELMVDPATGLPTTATYRLATPEIPINEDGSFSSAQDIRYEFTFDYAEVPDLAPPADPEIPPVTEDQVRNIAPAEIGSVTDIVDQAAGETQVFVVRGLEGLAVIRFEEGQLADSRTVDEAEDVWVESLNGVDGRFLAVIVNDIRIRTVELTYSRGQTDEPVTERLTTGGARPIFVTRVGHLGDPASWRALDDDGREVITSEQG